MSETLYEATDLLRSSQTILSSASKIDICFQIFFFLHDCGVNRQFWKSIKKKLKMKIKKRINGECRRSLILLPLQLCSLGRWHGNYRVAVPPAGLLPYKHASTFVGYLLNQRLLFYILKLQYWPTAYYLEFCCILALNIITVVHFN